MLEDFLQREESRRNRSLSKRFRTWLAGERGQIHAQKLEQILRRKQGEGEATSYLKKAEEAYKADDTHRKLDNKRKKSLKQFQNAFESWLNGDKGKAYLDAISQAEDEARAEMARLDAEKAFARAHPHLLPDDYRDLSKTRIRPVRFARARDVNDVTFDVIEPGLNQMGLVTSTIIRHWNEIVGEALGQNTRPERVVFPQKTRTHGTLYIMARQGFNTIIQHHSQQIIFRINSHFGFAAVSDLRISKRYYVEMETTGERVANTIISKRISPARQLDPTITTKINAIHDESYRDVLERLGKLIKARNT